MQANKPKQYCTTVCHLVSTASTPCENGVLQNSYQLPHQYTKSFTCTALIDSFWSFWQVCFSGLGILTFCQIVPFWADSTSVVCRCICCTFDQMLRSWSTVDKPVINECSTVPSHNTCSCQSGHGIVYQQRRENDIRTFSFIHKR